MFPILTAGEVMPLIKLTLTLEINYIDIEEYEEKQTEDEDK